MGWRLSWGLAAWSRLGYDPGLAGGSGQRGGAAAAAMVAAAPYAGGYVAAARASCGSG